MSTVYQIRDWDLHFENSKSRERDGKTWCAIPNKQDGLGYGRLMGAKDGPALYGAFIAVVLVASKQRRPRNGYLTDTGRADGCPYDAPALAIKTRMAVGLIARMLEVMVETIGWIVTSETSAPVVPAECPPSAPVVPPERRGLERKGVERKDTSDPRFDAWYEAYFRKEKRVKARAAWNGLSDAQKNKAVLVVSAWCRWKAKTDERKWWPLPATWLNDQRFDDEIPPAPTEVCSRCGKEPRRPDSGMGEKCFKELGLGGFTGGEP